MMGEPCDYVIRMNGRAPKLRVGCLAMLYKTALERFQFSIVCCKLCDSFEKLDTIIGEGCFMYISNNLWALWLLAHRRCGCES
jgi:hypothetical protein